MEKPKIVVCEFIDAAALGLVPPAATLLYDPELAADRPALLREIADAQAVVVRNLTKVDAELLDAAPQLRVVGRIGVGLENFDLRACADRGVAVRPATGANAVSVAEYVIAICFRMLLSLIHI